MPNNTKAISFWNFLKENTIEIPIIQRDYAQGRLGKENLRKTFLGDLKRALKDNIEMKLDFVYGSVEGGTLNPLDGQQRLTTLWLLHWYIALRAGVLNEENCKIFQRFTYETRISSREFCENLCNPKHFEKFDGYDIVGFITKQTWFYSAWKQDPTIQSMLRMLGGTKINDKKGDNIIDGIEELFDCPSECGIIKNAKCLLLGAFHDYWNKMTSDDCPIVFYHLPLQDFGLSDDLYIKMNARGKQLTSFENFKADLIGYIKKQSENEQDEWKELLAPESGIPIKLDTDWTDIFWKNKSKGITDNESKTRKSNQIDEIYFAFLNRFFWNELFIAKNYDKYILDIGKGDESSTQENNNPSYKYLNNSGHDNDTTIAYDGLEFYRYDNGEIPLSFFQKLKRVLDNYFTYSQEKDLPECPWNTSFRFIPKYAVENDNNIEITNNANEKILSVSTLNQVQRIVFFAICKYFDHDNNISDNESSIKQWLRVVWNLVSGEDNNGRPEIRSTSAMRTAIEFINSLDPHNVYNSLAERNLSGTTSFEERCKEEIEKAKQILNENGQTREYDEDYKKEDGSIYKTWEEIIKDTEKYAFFKGAIRFLFTSGEGHIIWSDFDNKWKKVKKYFDKNGEVKERFKVNAVLLRALLSRINIGENWFGYYKDFWRTSLLSKDNQSAIHYLLTTNELVIEEACKDDWIKNNDLLKTLLDCYNSWHILNNWRGFSVLTRYSQRRSDATSPKEIVVLNNLRNHLLSGNNIKVIEENKVLKTCYLYGWDIKFAYNDKDFFLWNRDGYVHLIKDLNNSEPIIKDDNRDNPEEKWFCFNPTSEMEFDITKFTAKLDQLIIDFQDSTQK